MVSVNGRIRSPRPAASNKQGTEFDRLNADVVLILYLLLFDPKFEVGALKQYTATQLREHISILGGYLLGNFLYHRGDKGAQRYQEF
jgi:hypothetical protein